MNKTQANRLLNVAFALRQAEEQTLEFGMGRVCKESCGTPMCAFGHYAAREDLQKTFRIRNIMNPIDDTLLFEAVDTSGRWAPYDGLLAQKHFGLGWDELDELFGAAGCNGAQTPEEAADYIEGFVRRKGWEIDG